MDPNQFPTMRTRLAIVLIILAALFGAGVSSILYVSFKNELYSNIQHRLQSITTVAGLQQNGDDFQKVQAQGDPYYNKILEQNAKIKRSIPDLRFVYTMRKDAQGNIYFVVDARIAPDEPDISNYGDLYKEPSQTLVDNFDTMTQTIVEPDFYTDEFNTFLSAYTPIK